VAFKGKLIGALLGSLAGPMGTILGGVVGHLFDRATEEQRALEQLWRPGSEADAISAAQMRFLSSLIGLSIAVANADGHVKVSEIEVIKSFFRRSFPYSEDDHLLIERIIDETFLRRDRLDVDALSAYFRATSSPSGRLLLIRLLFQLAAADREGASAQEEQLIRRMAGSLGVDAATYQGIRAEFLGQGQRAYEILGLSPEATEEQIRTSYRRLASKYHPDTVANLGEEFIKVAEEKFKAINEAYAQIRKQRGF
jgi:DnaJ like chaperone protein